MTYTTDRTCRVSGTRVLVVSGRVIFQLHIPHPLPVF